MNFLQRQKDHEIPRGDHENSHRETMRTSHGGGGSKKYEINKI